MTSRRASAFGARVRRKLARAHRRGWPAVFLLAALVRVQRAAQLCGLLLLAPALHAAMHSTHARHAPVLSAGKAPAHAVHDTGTRLARTPDKASNRRSNRSSAATRKTPPPSRHAKQSDDREHSSAKARSGHKRHQTQVVDEPMPVYRTRNEHTRHSAPEQFAETPLARPPHIAEPRLPPAYAPRRYAQGVPGNVARNNARHAAKEQGAPEPAALHADSGPPASDFRSAAQAGAKAGAQTGSQRKAPSAYPQALSAAPPAAFATGVSHPDDDERLPLRSTEAVPAPNPFAHPQRPAPIVLASAPTPRPASPRQPPPPAANVVEGFGAEVDFRGPVSTPAPAVVLPHESPAQQERDLRDAADIAGQPMFVPVYARDGKLVVPPPLKGSRDILVHQNQMADDAGLSRILDDDDLARMRRARLLVDLPETVSLHVNESLPENRRAARPWAVKFAIDAARAFYARFGEPLQVNSAVRTVAYQLRLQRTNGNAAAIDGEGASPHLTGQALDFGKRGMTVAEIAWMRSYLLPFIDAGKIDVEEEFQQACFHVSVYASYMPAPKQRSTTRAEVAQVGKTAHTHAHASVATEFEDNLR